MKEAEARGGTLPNDMLEAAKSVGIRRLLFLRYLDLQGSVWPLGMLMRSCSMLRDRMLADPSFLFKVGTEIVIDSCCATFADVHKRGMDFWAEFELYAGDLLVGIVVDIALVGMLAPYERIGKPSVKSGLCQKPPRVGLPGHGSARAPARSPKNAGHWARVPGCFSGARGPRSRNRAVPQQYVRRAAARAAGTAGHGGNGAP
ncbi:uncharacterized protein A4U43_C08F12540 [Asparagus officinalis]|nr:uncharacterized protein A4U43_C08F12540 [Asparagus officinalis]